MDKIRYKTKIIKKGKIMLVLKSNSNQKIELKIGGRDFSNQFLKIGGPCSVESQEQIMVVAEKLKKSGANILRGGAFKPRTSPYSFQGLGIDALKMLQKAGKTYDMPVASEVMDIRDVEIILEYVDILQIGARNMQNFPLLVEVGKTGKPVILKRGIYATVDEWLSSAEYIYNQGNSQIILCERGIRTVETHTRNTIDLGAVAVVKTMSNLPVIVDPSHATGRADLIEPMVLAGIMAGADGFMVEVHPDPPSALSDSQQQIKPSEFDNIMKKVDKLLELKNKW